MSLYKRSAKFDQYFDNSRDFLVLWKLEVLPNYQKKGYGKALVEFAKSLNMPIKTNPRVHSQDFWKKWAFLQFPMIWKGTLEKTH